jgi:hypothetical protein
MQFLPYDSFTIDCNDPIPVIVERLSAWLKPMPFIPTWRQYFGFAKEGNFYRGVVSPCGFKLSKIIHHRNSFLPVILGRFEAQSNGTTVHVTMRPAFFIVGVMIAWFSFFGWMLASNLVGARPGGINMELVWAPLVFMAFMWVLSVWAFWSQAVKDKNELINVLTGVQPLIPVHPK